VKLHAETEEATDRIKRTLMALFLAMAARKGSERRETDSQVGRRLSSYEARIQG
jgi:hypothetical protein